MRTIPILTFKQWTQQRLEILAELPDAQLIEDGYAWYLEQRIGRTPTITEVKEYGKITLLTTD